MSAFSDWLDIMLGEIARKREDAARALGEQQQREREAAAVGQGEGPTDSAAAAARFSVRVSRAS